MTVQVPDQQQDSRWKRNRPIFIGLAIVFLVGVAIIWIANIGSVLSSVLGIVFTLLSLLIAFLQWQPQWRSEAQVQIQGASAGKQGEQPFYEQIEGMALGVNKQKGALVVYTRKDQRGSTINLSFGFHSSTPKVDLASGVIGRKRKGSKRCSFFTVCGDSAVAWTFCHQLQFSHETSHAFACTMNPLSMQICMDTWTSIGAAMTLENVLDFLCKGCIFSVMMTGFAFAPSVVATHRHL